MTMYNTTKFKTIYNIYHYIHDYITHTAIYNTPIYITIYITQKHTQLYITPIYIIIFNTPK